MARIVFGAETLETRARDHGSRQRELPDVVGLQHARLGQGLRREQPDHAHHAVHPRRRDGAGHGRRVRDPDARRGAGRHGVLPDRATRGAGHLRLVRVVDVDADGRPDLRDPGAAARAVRPGRPGPPARRAVPQRRQLHGLQGARLPGGLRERRSASWPRCRPASTSTCTRPAGSRAGSRSATRSSCSTRTRPRWPGPTSPASTCPTTASRCEAMLDGGPGQHFLGSPHTLANFETAFWRSELSDNNSFEQWELERRPRRRAARQRGAGSAAWPSTRSRPSTRRSTRSSCAWIDAAQGELPRLGRLGRRPVAASPRPRSSRHVVERHGAPRSSLAAASSRIADCPRPLRLRLQPAQLLERDVAVHQVPRLDLDERRLGDLAQVLR